MHRLCRAGLAVVNPAAVSYEESARGLRVRKDAAIKCLFINSKLLREVLEFKVKGGEIHCQKSSFLKANCT